ncbi:hypothetical protein Dpoa2040_003109 [Dickeya sp. CFBP 2040]|nr:hypothetical protein [Dickeya sp. CFBP 2040]
MCRIRHIKGDPCLPPKRGLFPRHLRAALASFFVQVQKPARCACVPGGKGKNSIKKVVQNCAGLCGAFGAKKTCRSRFQRRL